MTTWIDDRPHVDESRLLDLVSCFRDYRYSGSNVCYPWPIPGVGGLKQEGAPGAPDPPATNCCTFAEAILVRAFHEVDPSFMWDRAFHDAMMIVEPGNHWGPIWAAFEAGFGDVVPDEDLFGPWRLCQGWNATYTRGHTFFLHGVEGDRCRLLEANNYVRAVRWRDVGSVDDFPDPPPAPSSWTKARLRRRYPHLRACALRVRG